MKNAGRRRTLLAVEVISSLALFFLPIRPATGDGQLRRQQGRQPGGGAAWGGGGAAPWWRRKVEGEGKGWRLGRGRSGKKGGGLGFWPPPPMGPLWPAPLVGLWAPRMSPLGLHGSPPLALNATSWACWPKAQAQHQKNRQKRRIFSLKNSNSTEFFLKENGVLHSIPLKLNSTPNSNHAYAKINAEETLKH